MPTYPNAREINDRIEELRRRMMVVAERRGIDHPKALKASNKLDGVLNEYQRLLAVKEMPGAKASGRS